VSTPLDRIVGLREARTDHPRDVLQELAWGPFGARVCRPPLPDAGFTWLRVTAVPATSLERSDPLETALGSFAGMPRLVRLRIGRDASGETALHIAADGQRMSAQLRSVLSPWYRLQQDLPAKAALVGPKGAGVVFRLQADRTQPSDVGHRPGTLLERLVAVEGPWSVDIYLAGLRQAEILGTRENAGAIAEHASGQVTSAVQLSAIEAATHVSAEWQRVVDWMHVSQGHLTECGAVGGWAASIWATASIDETLNQVLGAVHSGVPEREGRQFWAHDLDFVSDAPTPTSLLSTKDVTGLLQPPPMAVPGLLLRTAPPAHRRPDTSAEVIALGLYSGTDSEAAIGLNDLEGHTFITGTTGSGKSTTLHRLLAEAWNTHRVPFLVIDPAKDDYTSLASMVKGGLRQVTGRALRMNVLQPWPGTDPVEHISQISQAFKGSFVMPSPTPYVVTQLFDQIADDADGADLFDVRALLKSTVDGLGYAAEARLNIEASLRTRLNLLLTPARAHRFSWPNSEMLGKLFDGPAVVSLADVPDHEERSFIVLLLALATWSRAKATPVKRAVQHLLVLEEAHRVIPELGPADAQGESGSAQRASAELLSAMLAEVRAYGEQVVVVDQSPAKVSAEVLRNTNLKIAHRVVHPSDQELIAGALGIAVNDARALGTLERGEAVLSTRSQPVPQTVQVRPARAQFASPAAMEADDRSPWPCGCATPAEHFRAWSAQEEAAASMALPVLALRTSGRCTPPLDERTRATLAALALRVGAEQTCLAWAGIRYALLQERINFHTRDEPLARALDRYYNAWANSQVLATASAAPRTVDVLARLAFPAESHYFARLRRTRWEEEVPSVRDWVKRQYIDTSQLLGAQPAREILVSALHQAVSAADLPDEVAVGLARRAGLVSG